MAGNPFRRKADQGQPPQLRSKDAAKAFDDALQSVGTTDPTRRTPGVKKHVRIKTPPPLSPDSPVNTLIRRVSNEGHTGSPPPQSPVEGGSTPSDPFAQQFANEIVASQSKEAMDNTRRNSETASSSAPPAAALVLNPFQSTLATMEPGKGKDEVQKEREQSHGANAGGPRAGPEFDVDSFTKMLVTGAAPRMALNHSDRVDGGKQNQAPTQGSKEEKKVSATSSNLDRSTSEPSSTSKADRSSTWNDDDASEHNAGSTGARSALYQTRSAPPPPPRHKHGKSVKETGPQTVSFADFETVSADLRNEQGHRRLSGESNRTSSRQASTSSSVGIAPEAVLNSTTESTRRSRAPPPIPTARRTGSLKSHRSQDAETSSISSGQPQSPSHEPPSSPGLSQSSRVPPPPPSRRAGNRSSFLPDQVSSSEIASLNSDNASLAGESMLSTDSSSLRHAGAATSLASGASSGSGITTSQMPPPPPPRRSRGSSKSSVEAPMSGDHPRTSPDNNRRASDLSQVTENGSDAKAQQDILADLSAFQAEVEALRAASLRKAG